MCVVTMGQTGHMHALAVEPWASSFSFAPSASSLVKQLAFVVSFLLDPSPPSVPSSPLRDELRPILPVAAVGVFSVLSLPELA
jgi:hypothetical protein